MRLGGLRTQSPCNLVLKLFIECDNPLEVEAHFHEMFASARMHGEWFLLDASDYRRATQIVKGDDFNQSVLELGA